MFLFFCFHWLDEDCVCTLIFAINSYVFYFEPSVLINAHKWDPIRARAHYTHVQKLEIVFTKK